MATPSAWAGPVAFTTWQEPAPVATAPSAWTEPAAFTTWVDPASAPSPWSSPVAFTTWEPTRVRYWIGTGTAWVEVPASKVTIGYGGQYLTLD